LGGRLLLECRPLPDDMTQIYKKKFKGPIFTNYWSKWPKFTKKPENDVSLEIHFQRRMTSREMPWFLNLKKINFMDYILEIQEIKLDRFLFFYKI